MTEAPAWLRNEIKDGLQALIALSPDGTPASELLTKTADVWLIALQRGGIGCNIESIDAPRIREGFRRLFPTLRKWPVPAQLIEQIPGRPEQARLPAPPPSDEEIAEGLRKLATMKERAGINVDLPFPSEQDLSARRNLLQAQARMIRTNQENLP